MDLLIDYMMHSSIINQFTNRLLMVHDAWLMPQGHERDPPLELERVRATSVFFQCPFTMAAEQGSKSESPTAHCYFAAPSF